MKNSVLIGVRLFLVTFLVLGLGYPLLVTGVAQLTMAESANGSLVSDGRGATVGSILIGQDFDAPEYFHGRPSESGYDGLVSGGSNLGPTSGVLASRIASAAVEYGAPVDGGSLPADAVTGSGSGLDPDISPANALAQVPRVAGARGVDAAAVRSLVEQHITGRDLGFIGEPRVNVLRLNLALDAAFPVGG